MTSELLLRVGRQILPPDHKSLRANISRINRLGDLSIKWRRLGEAGITLLERGEYEQAKERPLSRLTTLSTASAQTSVRRELLKVEGANKRLKAPIMDVEFLGSGPYVSIAYILDTEQPGIERVATTNAIDDLSGVSGEWGEFKPHVSIATIPKDNVEDSILDEFWNIAPKDLTFLEVRAVSL